MKSVIVSCCIVAALLAAASSLWAVVPARLSPESLPNLVIGQEDMPWAAVLFRIETHPANVTERWVGPPVRRPHILTVSAWDIDVCVMIFNSAADAVRGVRDLLLHVATPPAEVTGQRAFALLGDRVWYGDNSYGRSVTTGARIILIRGNVVGDIHVGRSDGLQQTDVIALASRLAGKIDAALAGTPYPAPVLPPSCEDMGLDAEDAWDARNIGKMLSKRSTTIALRHGATIRALPAAAVAKTDYLVPLSHLAAAMGSPAHVTVGKGQATATLVGKTLVFYAGKRTVTVDGRIIPIGCQPQFKGKQVFVPISVLEKILGKRIAWGKTGKLVTASI